MMNPSLWVGEGAPDGVTTWSETQAQAWLDDPVWTPELLAARQIAGEVKCHPNAPRSTRSIVRRLRAALAPARPSVLAEVADELELPELAQALRAWPVGRPISASTLAACHPTKELDVTTRLLLALEHL